MLLCLLAFGCAGHTPAPLESVDAKDTEAIPPAAKPLLSSHGALPSLDQDDELLDAVGAAEIIPDPLEPWNRFWFNFNDVLIDYAIRPINTGYTTVVPEFARTGIGNFFHNLLFPVRFINCLLQGKGQAAGVEFSSFMLNTFGGLGGFIDLASSHEKVVEVDAEDTGQTLGVWGFGEGLYLVWSLLGPSNIRDSVGLVGDYFLNPIIYMGLDWEVELGLQGLHFINSVDSILDTYDALKGIAVEPYTAVRDGYTQYRRAKIAK